MPTTIQSGEEYRILTGGVAAAVKARPGVVGTIVVTATLTGSITIYDNPSAASGSLVYTSVATPAVGTVIPLNIPCRAGIFVTPGSAGTIVVSFT